MPVDQDEEFLGISDLSQCTLYQMKCTLTCHTLKTVKTRDGVVYIVHCSSHIVQLKYILDWKHKHTMFVHCSNHIVWIRYAGLEAQAYHVRCMQYKAH